MIAVVLLSVARPLSGQAPVSVYLDGVFFGDNTEFDGQFRPGETILGAIQRTVVEIRPGAGASVRFGLFTEERAGSASAVDHVLPIVALQLGTSRQQFILGTLQSTDRRGMGPDRTTPHGLLPPLAVETLWFTRAYEAGIQWLAFTGRFTQDAWFDYQLGNTAEHREKFDTGVVGRARIGGPLFAGYQVHIVHHGGQLFHSGPLADSVGLGPGLVVEGPLGSLHAASIEVFGLAAYDRPNRALPSETVEGKAMFVRLAAEARNWRGHLIVWRGDDFNHEDGDPNYQSRFPNGTRYPRTRDYSEAGLTKLFQPAPHVDFEASLRLYRIEGHYGYSYRLLSIVHLGLWRGTIPSWP